MGFISLMEVTWVLLLNESTVLVFYSSYWATSSPSADGKHVRCVLYQILIVNEF